MTKLEINGTQHDIDLPDDTPLLWVLRDQLGLTGTKFGCGMALCGACTVHIDGQPGRAVRHADLRRSRARRSPRSRRIGADRVGKAVQAAWVDTGVPQCGYCQAGQIMSATALLKSKPKPTDADIDACDGGQHLPLRHLRTNSRGDQAGRRREGSDRHERALRHDSLEAWRHPYRRRTRDRKRQPPSLPASRRPRWADWCSRSASRRWSGAADPPKYGADGMPHGWVDNPLVFVAIGEDGIVSIVCHRSEMGQGVRTGMPMIVADELEADWSRVRVVQAQGDEERYGNQDTDGSRSTRHFFMPMRRCGAAARQMLETAAATEWKVAGRRGRSEERRGDPQGEWQASSATGRWRRRPPNCRFRRMDKIRLKNPSQFRYIGTGKLKLVDGDAIVTGKAQYGMDTRIERHAVRRRRASAGLRRQGRELRCRRRPQGARRRQRGRDRRDARCAAVQPAGRRRGDREKHVGGDAGAQGAEDHVGRRPQRELRLGGLSRDARGVRGQAGQGRAQRRRRDRCDGERCQANRGAVLPAASRARVDGASCCDGQHRQRQMPGVWLLPVAAGSARPGRQASRHADRECHRQRDIVGRRASVASPSPIMASRPRSCRRRWTAARSRSSGRATTIFTTTTSTPFRWNISRPASTRKAVRSRGCTGALRRRSCRPSTRARCRRRTGNSGWA